MTRIAGLSAFIDQTLFIGGCPEYRGKTECDTSGGIIEGRALVGDTAEGCRVSQSFTFDGRYFSHVWAMGMCRSDYI